MQLRMRLGCVQYQMLCSRRNLEGCGHNSCELSGSVDSDAQVADLLADYNTSVNVS